MGFVEAVKSFYGRYVDFSTRSTRSEYWWVMLFMVIVYIVLAIPLMMSGSFNPGAMESGDYSGLSGGAIIPLAIFGLANIIPGIALAVRRLHDLDKSGWFYLIVIVGSIIPILGFLISIGWIIVMCLRGTMGDNRFGPDPLGASTGDTFS